MKLLFASTVCLTVWFLSAKRALSQGTSVSDDTAAVSTGLGEFALELLAKTATEAGDQLNIIMSTYSIWNLLAILNEGASGATLNQLRTALRLPLDNNRFKFGYKNLNRILNTNGSGIEINIANAIFTDRNSPVNKNFELQTSQLFNVNFLPVNFNQRDQAAEYIDSILAKATNNRIKHFINFEDLVDAKLLLTTAIFFKGEWSLPFNRSLTKQQPFFDEFKRQVGTVDMMYQSSQDFPFARFDDLQAYAVGLPYGKNGNYWMVLMRPWDGNYLTDLLNAMTKVPFKYIIDKMEKDSQEYMDDVIVQLPKFKMTSDFVLNVILEKMGIVDVFDPYYADLGKIAPNVFLSRVIHKAEIEVDEEGTVASAATVGNIVNKNFATEFIANRPFAYFIVEKNTSTILFAGKLSNPNDLI